MSPDPRNREMLFRRVTSRRWRIAVERRAWLRHHWTVEEGGYGGAWKPKANGQTITRRGAVSAARRRTLGMKVFQIDRQEEIIVVQESYVPDPEVTADVASVLLGGDDA